MPHRFFIYTITIVALFLQACIKDKPVGPQQSGITVNAANTVFVTNEGNYGAGNSSVSLYDPASNGVVTDYYRQQNNNQPLGDVCQSMTRYNGHYYIVVNNSAKIVVVNASDFKKTATITGFNSPRYMLPVTYNKAYVSDLYANSIQVVDLNTNTIKASVPCGGWTEQMALIYNKAFVTNVKSNYTYVLNTITDQLSDSILVGKGAGSLVFDKNDKLWILSSGSSTGSITAKLLRVDPVTLQTELSILFNPGDSPSHLCINNTKDTLYYLSNGVYQLPIQNSQLPPVALISQGTKVFYGLGINPNDNSIYVSDAIDYVQSSKVLVYDVHGSQKTSFSAGIIAGGFVFQ